MVRILILILPILLAFMSTAYSKALYFQAEKDSLVIPKDTSAVKTKVDTLKPIFSAPAFAKPSYSYLLSKKEADKKDYRYTGDFFKYVPFGFTESLGSLGQPEEIKIYGLGYNAISVVSDGVEINERHTNAFDFYTYRSELMDSLYIPTPTKAFLFGKGMNPAAVVIYPYDKLISKPFSRIRYFQAPNEEGSIDGFFSIIPFNKVNIYGGFQNSSISSNYKNSEYGLWNATFRVRYIASNVFNFLFSYNYSHSTVGLNGGVDYDYLQNKFGADVANRILYSPFEAPVNYENRYQKITTNRINFKTLIRLNEKNIAQINSYYGSHLTEFRQDEHSIKRIYDNDRNKYFGINFVLPLNINPFGITLGGSVDNTSIRLNSLNLNKNFFTTSLYGDFNVNLISDYLNVEMFSKLCNFEGKNLFGYGAQMNFSLTNKVKLTIGISHHSVAESIEEFALKKVNGSNGKNVNVFFSEAVYKNKNINIALSFFNRSFNSYEYWVKELSTNSLKIKDDFLLYYRNVRNGGVSLNGKLKFYKFLSEMNLAYYLNEENEDKEVPRFTAFAGLYYVDTLFNRNLKLKAGLNFYFNTGQSYREYLFEFKRDIFYAYDKTRGVRLIKDYLTGETYDLDLFIAGTIQERATLYLKLENVFNQKYFVVPYYPMSGITFRFGIAWEFYN